MINGSYLESIITNDIIPEAELSQVTNIGAHIGDKKDSLSKLAKSLGLSFIGDVKEFNSRYTVDTDEANNKLLNVASSERIIICSPRVDEVKDFDNRVRVLATSNPFASQIHKFNFTEILIVPDSIINTYISDKLDLQDKYKEKDINEYVDRILELAINKEATDIHMDGKSKDYEISLRIDNVLSDVLDRREIDFMNIVIKILRFRCKIDTTSIVPKLGGSFISSINNQKHEWRFQLIQLAAGVYKITLRLAHKFTGSASLDGLNYCPKVLKLIRETMFVDIGLTIFSGVTGCGKTTTLYAYLVERAIKHKKQVFTLEDPVEALHPELNQANITKNFTYQEAIAAALRSDPDDLLVGEIRDSETAQAAMDATISSHKTLTTLHLGRVELVLKRLSSFGLNEDTIMQNLLSIVIQRKVSRLCDCKKFNASSGFYEANTSLENDCKICAKTLKKGYRSIVPINEAVIIKEGATEFKRSSYKDFVTFEYCLDWHLETGNIDKISYDEEIKKINTECSSNNSNRFKKEFELKKEKKRNSRNRIINVD